MDIQEFKDILDKGEGGLYECPKPDQKPLLRYWFDPITNNKTKVFDYGDN